MTEDGHDTTSDLLEPIIVTVLDLMCNTLTQVLPLSFRVFVMRKWIDKLETVTCEIKRAE